MSYINLMMACANERIRNRFGRLVKRGGLLSQRYYEQRTCKFVSKDHQLLTPVLRKPEQRFIILAVVSPEDEWKFLGPLSFIMQGSELKKHVSYEAHVMEGDLDSSPPLIIVFQAGLLMGQKTDLSECPGSVTSCSSSGANTSGELCNNKEMTKPFNSPSTSLPDSVGSNKFSPDDSVLSFSKVYADKNPEVDKPVKSARRKNRKKKKKQSRKCRREKLSPALEIPFHDASISCMSVGSNTTNRSENLASFSLSLQNVTIKQHEVNINHTVRSNCSAEQLIRTPNGSESCQPSASFSKRPVSEEVDYKEIEMGEDSDRPVSEDVCYNKIGTREDSNCLVVKSNSTHNPEMIRSTSCESSINEHPVQKGIQLEKCVSISFDKDDVSKAGSDVDIWKKDSRKGYDSDVETWSSNKEDEGLYSSEGGRILGTRYSRTTCDKEGEMCTTCHSSKLTWLKDVAVTDHRTERTERSSHASSCDDFQPVINRKRNMLSEKAYQALTGIHRSGSADILHSRGDGTYLSLRQTVQKNNIESTWTHKETNLTSPRVDMLSKNSARKEMSETPVRMNQSARERLRSYTCSDIAVQPTRTAPVRALSEDCGRCEISDEGKILSYNVPVNIEMTNSASKQGNQYPMMVSHTDDTNLCRSEISVQQKGLEILPPLIHPQCISCGFNSHCRCDSQKVVAKPTDNASFSQSGAHHRRQKNNLLGGNPITVCGTSSNIPENPIRPSALTDQTNITVYLESSKVINENILLKDTEECRYLKSESEGSHADSSNMEKTSSVPQKYVPVDRNESVALTLGQTDSLKASVVNGSVLRTLNTKNGEKELPSFNSHHVSTGWTASHPRACGESGGLLSVSDQKVSGFKTDLDKIVQAVHESSKFHTAIEGVHLVAGSPVAEFENFLHSASPLLDQICCRTCIPSQSIGNCSCVHKIPNIPLECLWQWYEKPGSYGIGIKVEDCCSSKAPHSSRSTFRAYFVPYISAIQIFGWSRRSEGANNFYHSLALEHFAPAEIRSGPVKSTYLDDGELLFEYFEYDQPRQRTTLYEKIKELAREDASSDSKVYGDPSKLECLNLHDLHPASWYSVAWYPIYRIPDGKFRAAFLTYHSLGHFVPIPSKRPGGIAHIVSPVVGLQSYNAKGECWFKPRGQISKVVQTGEALTVDPSDILKQRLDTLEHTASVMARASICKNNRTSANMHPDYEFFMSRRW